MQFYKLEGLYEVHWDSFLWQLKGKGSYSHQR